MIWSLFVRSPSRGRAKKLATQKASHQKLTHWGRTENTFNHRACNYRGNWPFLCGLGDARTPLRNAAGVWYKLYHSAVQPPRRTTAVTSGPGAWIAASGRRSESFERRVSGDYVL